MREIIDQRRGKPCVCPGANHKPKKIMIIQALYEQIPDDQQQYQPKITAISFAQKILWYEPVMLPGKGYQQDDPYG